MGIKVVFMGGCMYLARQAYLFSCSDFASGVVT